MVLFRKHKSSLENSMQTVQEIESEEQLIELINQDWKEMMGKVEHIKYSDSFYDKRVKWDTIYVSVKFTNAENYFTIGMLNGKLK